MTNQEIFEGVRKVLVESLNAEAAQITPTTAIVQDLQAESIDFLDINFRLEKQFSIKIDRNELLPDTDAKQSFEPGSITAQTICDYVTKKLKEKALAPA